MKKIVKLTENDLMKIVKRVINEEEDGVMDGGTPEKFVKQTTATKGTWHIAGGSLYLHVGNSDTYAVSCGPDPKTLKK
jgi:hypothetical protein